MKQKIFIFSIFVFLLGCASAVQLKNGVDASGSPVCLTDCKEIPATLEKFKKTHDLTTEEDEIDYLFYRIRSSHYKFIRNGLEVDSAAAAEFLRWKIGWYEKHFNEKIDSDEDFVSKVLRGSEKTGKPYLLIPPDGTRHNAQFVMQNELNYLNAYNTKNAHH